MTSKEAMKVLGVSYTTLWRYVQKGLIRVYKYQMKNKMGLNNYWDEDVYALCGNNLKKKAGSRKVAAYFRVNGKSKKDDEMMVKQKETVMKFCAARGISIEEVYEDRANSIQLEDHHRPDWHRLIQDVMKGDVAVVVIETPCRLSRFAMVEMKQIFRYYECEIVIINPFITDLFYREEQASDVARLLEKMKLDRGLGK